MPGLGRQDPGRGDLPPRRHVVGRADEQPDVRVTERDQVAHRLVDGDRVVARHARESEPVDGGVDQDRGQAAFGEPGVVRVRRIGLRVQAAGEDDTRHLLLEQQIDIVRLGHAPDRLGAQHRREPLLREGAADDLGEGREDRVLELWQDEPDKAGAFAAKLGRAVRSRGRRARSGPPGGSIRTRRPSR